MSIKSADTNSHPGPPRSTCHRGLILAGCRLPVTHNIIARQMAKNGRIRTCTGHPPSEPKLPTLPLGLRSDPSPGFKSWGVWSPCLESAIFTQRHTTQYSRGGLRECMVSLRSAGVDGGCRPLKPTNLALDFPPPGDQYRIGNPIAVTIRSQASRSNPVRAP